MILTEDMLGIWFWFLPGKREDAPGKVFIKVKREEKEQRWMHGCGHGCGHGQEINGNKLRWKNMYISIKWP